MKVYAVFKEGAYRHECGGIFTTIEAAEKAAEEFINGERDDHHEYDVVPFELDVKSSQTEMKEGWSGGDVEEPNAVRMYSRSGKIVTKYTPKSETDSTWVEVTLT